MSSIPSRARASLGHPHQSVPISMGAPPTSYSSLHDRIELERMEKEKREREMAEIRDRENR